MFASSALRRSLAAQILSSDSTLQQAALKGLRVSRPCLKRLCFCLQAILVRQRVLLCELISQT